MQHSVLKLATVLLCFSFFSCKKNTSEFSFYYWKTKFDLSQTERKTINDLDVKTMYTRFFDVDIDKASGDPIPVGVIDDLDIGPEKRQYIPVVFITNRTFLTLKKDQVILLAKNIINKINFINKNYSELQFDCDWSAKTKENYFFFLEEVRKIISKRAKLTCTIRLHQVKYALKTGIPPVDRGTLMFYNIGDLYDPMAKNSIYNVSSAEKYTGFLKDYKLPLDVALPIFRWYIQYRNTTFISLITKDDMPQTNDTTYFLPITNFSSDGEDKTIDSENNIKFKVKRDHLENGIFYPKNDILKLEALNDKQLIEVAELLSRNLKKEDRRIIFFDLDEKNINYYDKETFTKIKSVFN